MLPFLAGVLWSTAHAAPVIGPLEAGGAHGIVFVPEGEAKAPMALQVLATSKPAGSVAPAELPEGLAGRVRDAEEGVYHRVQWDKGALLADNWSARWTGTLKVGTEGEYTFYLTTDDGARMTVDGKRVIDAWVPRPPTTSEAKAQLTAGDHEVVVEYFEAGGGAVAKLEWSGPGTERQPIPAGSMTSDGEPGWRAEYFLSTELQGQPFVLRAETINDDWLEAGPKVGDEEPGSVCLEWVRIAPGAVVGRVHADPGCSIGFTGPGLGATAGAFTYQLEADAIMMRQQDGGEVAWAPPSDGACILVAGASPLPAMSGAEVRRTLHDAAMANAKPSLPPYPKDAEGWVTLFNGTEKAGWKMRGGADNWKVVDGVLSNAGAGSDIYTEWTFGSFDLHVEFRVPAGSNSGVYLQGNYEIQVDDCFGQPVRDTMCGAVYHRITPSVNAAKKPGEWQTFDASFTTADLDDNGRIVWPRVTLTFNGVKTIDDKAIEGLTGSAMGNTELAVGPLMFQGDHGPVDYRNVRVRPR